jgi:AcrR family transcriptional regulator
MGVRSKSPSPPPAPLEQPSPKRRATHTWRKNAQDSSVLLVKDAERTRAEIIAVATEEFSTYGYSGGRINEIAERTRTSKRMIYYYFGSKEGLYRAVLYEHYRRLRTDEQDLHLEKLPPLDALKALIHFTFDWYLDHADQVPLVMVENIHQGRHIKTLPTIEILNSVAINVVQNICKRGVADGVIRPGLRPIDIYMSIASASFFNVSNRYTFAAIFGHDMTPKKEAKIRRDAITEMILRYVAVDADSVKAKR